MEYPKPSFTADMCVYAHEGDQTYVLLIRRGRPPYAGSWALPGGFVEPGELVEEAAARELLEETGVQGLDYEPVGVFSEDGRDPRGWTMTEAFRARVDRSRIRAVGQDDAAEARWFQIAFSLAEDSLSMTLTGGDDTLTALLTEPYRVAGQLRPCRSPVWFAIHVQMALPHTPARRGMRPLSHSPGDSLLFVNP